MLNLHPKKEQILIIGDEAKSSQAVRRLLETAGYVVVATDSFEATQQRLVENFSLILIEPAAARVTGTLTPIHEDEPFSFLKKHEWAQQALSFCKTLRDNEATAEIPILVLSKNHLPQEKIAWLNAGATAYLTKPFQKGEIVSRVNSLIKSWQQGREKNEKFEQLNLLHSVSAVLTSSLEPEVLLKGTLSALLKGFNANAGVVYLKSDDNPTMRIAAAEGFATAKENWDGSVLDLFFRTTARMNGAPLIFESLPESSRVKLEGEHFKEIQSVICAPLITQGAQTGAICLVSEKPNPFPKQSAELLSTISNQLSMALENSRLYNEAKKSASQLSFVYNLGNNLMTSLELGDLLSYAIFALGKNLRCDVCAIIVKSTDETGQLAAARYSPQGEPVGSQKWFHEERVNNFLNRDQTLSAALEYHAGDIELHTDMHFLSDKNIAVEILAPLVFDEKLLGVLICASENDTSFDMDEQKLIGSVAHQLSLAIRNTELYQKSRATSINLAVEVSHRMQEIEEQKRFIEKIIDSLPVSLYVIDRDMHIVAWNRNREIGNAGMKREEVLGKNVFSIFSRQPRIKLQEEFLEVFRKGNLITFEQDAYEEGQKRVWRISKIPMRVDNAEVSHVITVGEDVTEQKQMNEAVIHAEKLASIGRLASGVVHEINNPLATIAACAEALVSRIPDVPEGDTQEDFREYLQIIKDEAFRCKTITNSLLEFSHQRQAEKMPSEINQLIDQTLLLVKHHPKIGRMKIVKELDTCLPPVLVNEAQMKQIFIALISNAFDAMEDNPNSSLTIRTGWHIKGEERSICAEFVDSGCGIPKSHLTKIFDPFFTTKPIGRGTGLGLSVCYGIVTDHGGKIEVDSSENEGSTFRIILPASQSEPYLALAPNQLFTPTETERTL